MQHLFRLGILAFLLGFVPLAMASDVVVLTETPVGEFTLPDGSVLKNAFVWRRSSEGLMIVHDDGQFFLNFKTFPEDWTVAYFGEPEELIPSESEIPPVELVDKYKVASLIKTIPELGDKGVEWLLRADVDDETKKTVLAMALFQSLVLNNGDKAKRYFLLIEEMGYKIDAVKLDKIFNDCATCSGKGEYPCATCRGRGQLLDRQYCEVNRDHLVRTVNERVGDAVALTRDPSIGISTLLPSLPDLDPDACTFYLSDAYTGVMDTNLLVAAVLQSMLKEKMKDADRFNLMVEAKFPKNKMLKIQDYIKVCKSCKATGLVEQPCPTCTDGKGKYKGKKKGQCPECESKGTEDKRLGSSGECEVCEGSGDCATCKGEAIVNVRCSKCGGRGRLFETMRAKIKLELLVNDLNDYYALYLEEKERPAVGEDGQSTTNAVSD